MERMVMGNPKLQMFVIDESNTYLHPKPSPLPTGIVALNDRSRHENLSFGCIARRPSQLHSDIVELAHYIICFGLRGVNDVRYLDSINRGLGSAVANLPQYHFIVVDERRNWQVYKPV